jgi:hypothetical protein
VVSARSVFPGAPGGMTRGDQLCDMPRGRTFQPLALAQFARVTTSAADAGAEVHTPSTPISPDQFS